MTEFRRAGLLAAVLVSVSLSMVACGGAAATPTPTPTPVPVDGAPATPTPTPETGATPETGSTPGAAIPTFDLGALTGALPGVDSYRTSFSVGGVEQYRSVVVTKPVLSKAITVLDAGAVQTRFVIIGEEAWTADGPEGAFTAVPAVLASTMLIAFDPALMLGAYAGFDYANGAADQGVEEKNGIQAHHVKIDSTTLVGAAAAMPPGSAIDIWIADAGYLVSWEMSGFPEDANISIQVTGVNDPANKVERPA